MEGEGVHFFGGASGDVTSDGERARFEADLVDTDIELNGESSPIVEIEL